MSKKYKKLLVYLAIIAFPAFLIFASPSQFNPIKASVNDLTVGPWKFFSWPLQEARKLFHYHATYARYVSLQREIGALHSRLIGQEEVLRENNRLKKLLNFKNDLVFSSVAANVIGRDPTNWNSAIILDRGESQGIRVGMPVVNESGVVGKIAEVSGKNSKVIMVNDPSFSVAALVQRSREGCLISGSLKGMCRLRYLPENADVEVGDPVITSQMSSAFPEGLLIGKVIGLEENPGSSSVEWLLEPAVDLSQLEQVLVIQK